MKTRNAGIMMAGMLVVGLQADGALARAPSGSHEITPFGESYAARGFEQINREKGVTVFKHKKSDVIRLGAEGRIAAPPADVREALLDYDSQVGIIDRVSKITVLDRGLNWMLVYQRLNLPVISDRDYNLIVRWGEDPDGTLWIKYQLATFRGLPEQEDVVRTPFHSGSWQFRPTNDGKATLVRYQVGIDLGGLVPKWMARAGAGDEVPGVFEDVCRMLGQHKKEEVKLCLLQ